MEKTAIRYGILTGLGVVAFLSIFYMMEKSWMRQASVLWASMLIYIVGMVTVALTLHRNRVSEEELPIRQMIQAPFVVFLIANLFFYTFFYLMLNVVDEELLHIHQEATHAEALQYYKDSNVIGQIRKAKMEDYTPTVSSSFFRYVIGAIGGFALSLLIGLFIRRT